MQSSKKSPKLMTFVSSVFLVQALAPHAYAEQKSAAYDAKAFRESIDSQKKNALSDGNLKAWLIADLFEYDKAFQKADPKDRKNGVFSVATNSTTAYTFELMRDRDDLDRGFKFGALQAKKIIGDWLAGGAIIDLKSREQDSQGLINKLDEEAREIKSGKLTGGNLSEHLEEEPNAADVLTESEQFNTQVAAVPNSIESFNSVLKTLMVSEPKVKLTTDQTKLWESIGDYAENNLVPSAEFVFVSIKTPSWPIVTLNSIFKKFSAEQIEQISHTGLTFALAFRPWWLHKVQFIDGKKQEVTTIFIEKTVQVWINEDAVGGVDTKYHSRVGAGMYFGEIPDLSTMKAGYGGFSTDISQDFDKIPFLKTLAAGVNLKKRVVPIGNFEIKAGVLSTKNFFVLADWHKNSSPGGAITVGGIVSRRELWESVSTFVASLVTPHPMGKVVDGDTVIKSIVTTPSESVTTPTTSTTPEETVPAEKVKKDKEQKN